MKYFAAILFLFALTAPAQTPAVFNSYHATQDPELNPDPNSPFWKDVKGIVLDHTIRDEPDLAVASEARSRWTGRYLYFLFFGKYELLHLHPNPDTAKETQHLWEWDDFELYLGANFENINLYGEFQISPQSEFLDNGIDATRNRPGWNDEYLWNSGMTVKSRIDPEKKIWYGVMRIPIEAIDKRPPKAGNEMRVNVYRLQQAPEGQPRHFLAWKPTGENNPHRPLKFGTLRLVE